jgi:2-dehydro-3-deoxyphosphogluconate aldolase/(4S)-4-hydroxy-2-oxoglutarate aldolase
MNEQDFLRRAFDERATAILRTDNQETAARAMEAVVRGGFRIIEFTLGCPGAYELIEEFARRDDLLVGVGTVLEPEQARRAVDAGASFVVSPATDEAVIRTALDAGAVAMPGAYTATEMVLAQRAGAQLQKLFPAPANGPEYARSLLGPLPGLRIVPTNGVTPDNVGEWFAAGVFGVGWVASLFDADDLRAGRFDNLEERARQCLAATREAKRPQRDWGLVPVEAMAS